MIPPKIIITGDLARGQEFIGFAKNQLSILENLMSFQGLDSGFRTIKPYPDVVVEIWKSFNLSVIKIKVKAVSDSYLDGKKIKKAKQPKEYAYFVRIKYPDPTIVYASLVMDRIIIYEMDFDNDRSDAKDPSSKTHRNNGFVPGEGRVILDVDVQNEIVYVPQVTIEEEKAAAIEKAMVYASVLPTQSIAGKAPTDKALYWFAKGDMGDPSSFAGAGGYSVPLDTPSISLSEGIDIGDGVTWWPFTDEVVQINTWRAKWSPLYGGTTGIYRFGYPWVGLTDVEEFYGEYGASVTAPTVLAHLGMCRPYSLDNRTKPTVVIANFEQSTVSIDRGTFFTSSQASGINSFFTFTTTNLPARSGDITSLVYHCGTPDDSFGNEAYFSEYPVGSDATGFSVYDTLIYIQAGNAVGGTTSLVTPLEEISPEEYRSSSAGSATCSEFSGYYWDSFDTIQVMVYNTQPSYLAWPEWTAAYNSGLEIFGHSNIGQGAFVKDTSNKRDYNHFAHAHALDEMKITDGYQTKYFSLLFFEESKAGVLAGKCDFISSPQTNCYCDGVHYPVLASSPVKKRTFIGCVLYIFAPKWFANREADQSITYWDMHSARRDGIVNPYRCLDLEEYLINVFTSIQDSLDSNSSIPRLNSSPGIAYTMDHYEITITDGFCVKL